MIREYTSNDTDALIAIWEKANALAHPFLPQSVTNQVRNDMRTVYLPNAQTWVLEEGGKPVGFIAMIDTEIGGLFLDPANHGRGLGRLMVDHVVGLKGPLTVEVFKDNKIGLPFYERYGFAHETDGTFELSGHPTLKMAMSGAK
ncbi:MAG: GNAT family N-acetyltransferase [Stappiaceae bacterium]